MNQGKGIYLVNSKEQLIEKLNMNGDDNASARRSLVRPPQGRVIQRYSYLSTLCKMTDIFSVTI